MIILGSTSPRRKNLLNKITSDFKIIAPLFNEKTLPLSTKHYALEESYNKAKSLESKINKDDCLICVDTIVFYNNKIYGKPTSGIEATSFLNELSGHEHEVISGYTIIYKNRIIKKEVISYVVFNKLNDEQVCNYIKNVNVFDKAGSYSFQDDKNYNLIKETRGSTDNIMGFPTEKIKKDLIELGLI